MVFTNKLTWKKSGFSILVAVLLASVGIYSSKITQADSLDGDTSTAEDSYLQKVKQRGYLICGVSGEVPGFSFINASGKYAGMDVDFCRAVASALFDDPDKVEFRNLNAEERFDVLQSGEIDLLSRNTTNTLSRDAIDDLEFAPTTFYDAQGIMVDRASGIESLADLEGKSICVLENTTSYDNLQDYVSQKKITYKPVVSDDRDSLFDAYEHNSCQAITGDTSFLIARRVLMANPNEHQILSEKIAQEPLAPAIVDRDSQWFDVVKWVTFALIQAEELDVNSVNLNTKKASKDSEVRSFLGVDSNFGSEMGLTDDFTMRIIRHVGNYQEIYDRNIGKPFGLKRGQNALWKDGGLMYSPPFN